MRNQLALDNSYVTNPGKSKESERRRQPLTCWPHYLTQYLHVFSWGITIKTIVKQIRDYCLDCGMFLNTRPTYAGFLLRSPHEDYVVYVSLYSYPLKQEFPYQSTLLLIHHCFHNFSRVFFSSFIYLNF